MDTQDSHDDGDIPPLHAVDDAAAAVWERLTLKAKSMLDYARTYGYLPAPQNRGDVLAHDLLGDMGCAHLRVLTDLGRRVAAHGKAVQR